MSQNNIVQLPVERHVEVPCENEPIQNESKKQGNERNRSILLLSHSEARAFLLKSKSYCNFDLPEYIEFSSVLSDASRFLNGKNISDFHDADIKPWELDGLNHVILNNKDGRYAWRPLQLIHPLYYVSLVHKITEQNNWEIIQEKFVEFSRNSKIDSMGLPVESLTNQKDKAEQILHWWNEVEQRSIELSLDYEYLIQTDITDCYGSIYTHSISWALHTKALMKKKENRTDQAFIGNVIDRHIQHISRGQTNGIPQGSVLMDFISEMVLGYADMELSEKIDGSINDYHIVRYRDDYRIFVNNPQDGEKIVKLLTEVMLDLGLKLNPSKTKISNQVIKESIKSDKLYWIGRKPKKINPQKHLLMIHILAEKYPNSGSLITALTEYHKRIIHLKRIEALPALIGIVVDIAYHNPKTYAISSAILSKFISFVEGVDQKRAVFDRIKKRFNKIPNTGHLYIWLQRITLTFDRSYRYEEPICELIFGVSPQIWNADWIVGKMKSLINPNKIIDRKQIAQLPPVITKKEVELFTPQVWS